MGLVHSVVDVVYLVVSALGAVVVLWGVVEAMKGFLCLKFRGEKDDPIAANESVRQRLGAHLLLGLEIFIAADILSSVVSPSWQKVGMLAAIVGIRTVLSYFLRWEMKRV